MNLGPQRSGRGRELIQKDLAGGVQQPQALFYSSAAGARLPAKRRLAEAADADAKPTQRVELIG
jgi:hypothetical protein